MGMFDISKKEFKVRLSVQEPGKSAEFIHDRVIAMDWGDAKKVLKAKYPYFKALLDCKEIKADSPKNSSRGDNRGDSSSDGARQMHWLYFILFGWMMAFATALGFFPLLYFPWFRTLCMRVAGYW